MDITLHITYKALRNSSVASHNAAILAKTHFLVCIVTSHRQPQYCLIRQLKGGNWVSYCPCDNVMFRRPFYRSPMEVMSHCTFGFCAIFRRDLRTLSLPSVLNTWLPICVREFKCPCGKSVCTTIPPHTWWQDGRPNRFPFFVLQLKMIILYPFRV